MMDNFKSGRKTTLLVAAMLFLVLSILFFRSSFDKMLIALLVGLAYFTGIISFFFGIVFSLLTFLAALPIISTLQAYVAFVLARINYIVFKVFVGKVLRRMGWYRRVETWVKNSPIVKRMSKIFHSLLRDLGLERPRRVKVFEVTECKSCKRDVPIDGALCPYCGEKVEIDPKSWRAIFQSQFEDFYSHIKDLINLEELRMLSKHPKYIRLAENTKRLEHSYLVSWLSYKIALRLDLDRRLAARAGLLHDIGYDPNSPRTVNQLLFHAKRGSKKISEIGEDRRISEIVSQHMFPFGKPPTSVESWILWTADKIASITDLFRLESLFQGDELWRKIKEQT